MAGTLKFGVLWKTVTCAASRARIGVDCTPDEPVPITPTPQAGHVDRLVRPLRGVQDPPGEGGQTGQVRPLRRRQVADRPDQEPGFPAPARLGLHTPAITLTLPVAPRDPLAQVHVAAQVEPVGDVLDVAEDLRLSGVALRPAPFLFQLGGERVGIVVALDVAPGTRVPVPVPDAADVVPRLEDGDPHSLGPQGVQRPQAGEPGADDDHVEVTHRGSHVTGQPDT
jgi:hypothetical protein